MSDNTTVLIPADQRSSAPMVLAIVGFVFSLITVVINTLAALTAFSAGAVGLGILAIIPAVLPCACLIGGINVMRQPLAKAKTMSILMTVYAALQLVACICTLSFIALIGAILFLVGGIIAITTVSKARPSED